MEVMETGKGFWYVFSISGFEILILISVIIFHTDPLPVDCAVFLTTWIISNTSNCCLQKPRLCLKKLFWTWRHCAFSAQYWFNPWKSEMAHLQLFAAFPWAQHHLPSLCCLHFCVEQISPPQTLHLILFFFKVLQYKLGLLTFLQHRALQ